jgi:hypothetical protein
MMHLMGLHHDFEVKNISQAMMTLLFESPRGLSFKKAQASDYAYCVMPHSSELKN